MNMIFNNKSKSTVILFVDNQSFIIEPEARHNLNLQNNAIVELYIDKESMIKYRKNIFICYEFNILSKYQIISNSNDNVVIDLFCYQIGGNDREYYSFVSPFSQQVELQLLSQNVINGEQLVNDIKSVEIHQNEMKQKSRKRGFKVEVITETILSGLPLLVLSYYYMKKADVLSNIQMALLMFAILLVVFLLVFCVTKLFNNAIQKRYKSNKPSENYTDFLFSESHIQNVIFNKENYKNKL